MQLALYRAERPEVFEEIIGQKHIVRILRNQLKTGTVSQAYLFSGTHGTGKTSTARILAKALNCLAGDPSQPGAEEQIPCGRCENCEAIREGRFVDVIELDAASNNGVDDLRAIIDMVKYPPTVGRYKVYIIDEVHMLSQAAENAFLKTLEEPPEHAVFILATTDPQKVRSTIRSRCMQLNFRRVSEEELVMGMDRICAKRGVRATKDALVTIASRADGSVRDALSILEQCMAAGDKALDRNLVLEYTGAAGDDFYLALTEAVIRGDAGRIFKYIEEIIRRGKDSRQILKDWLTHYRNLMVIKYVERPERMIGASAENIERLRKQAASVELKDIERAIRLISEYINLARYSEHPRILLETAAVRLAGNDADTTGAAARPASGQTRQAKPAAGRGSASVPVIRAVEQTSGSGQAVPSGSAPEEDDEPLTQITSAPREKAGDPEEMWGRITGELGRDDRSFVSFIGNHSRGTEFDSGELIVTVRQNKMRLANDKLSDITRAARNLYGPDVFVTLRGGDPDEGTARDTGLSEQETSRVIDQDINISEVASDIEAFFGIRPEISD